MASPALPAASPQSLTGLAPFLKPYRGRIALATLFLLLASGAMLAFPVALRETIDGGIAAARGESLVALKDHFVALFGVAVVLGLFSAGRYYMVSWLGERVTAGLVAGMALVGAGIWLVSPAPGSPGARPATP